MKRIRARTIAKEVDARAMALKVAVAAALTLLALAATSLDAQEGPQTLTLDEAIALAKQNNPTYLSTQNDAGVASWQKREAYASFLPRVTANGGAGYQEAGAQRIGTLVFDDQVTDWAFSSYSLNFGVTISGQEIFGIPNARANQRAVEARVAAQEFNVESLVAFQYMLALRARDRRDVAQRQVEQATQNLNIVRTRIETGSAAGTEGTQAEVGLGQAEVAVVQAERDLRAAILQLAEQMGVPLPVDVELSSEFEVFQPDFDPDRLLQVALESNPSLEATRAQESASVAQARATSTSQYLPTVNLSTGFRGNALQALNEDYVTRQVRTSAENRVSNCEFNNALNARLTSPMPGYSFPDCSQYALTDSMVNAALASNEVFPFNFTKLPVTFNLNVSIPVFTGFTRQRQVAQANAAAEDAEYSRRAEELRVRTAVVNFYDNLMSAYRVVQMEERNQALAEEQLQLQQRRYSLGAGSLLELLTAQTTATTADQTYLNAVYDFHYNLIALETAVGQRLRPE